MCGICGIISFQADDSVGDKIEVMMHSIRHRGPDGRGSYINKGVALGHLRLSIIDLSEIANQPMFTDDGQLVVVFNGEIYNYQALRKELENKYPFKTHSDTEVILYAYREWGVDFLHRLNGMFSFVIYNKQEGQIIGVRDRYGIKPFFYTHTGNHFAFASEIKGVLAAQLQKAEIHEPTLYDFITYNRTDHTQETCFKGIFNLRPGHLLELNTLSGEMKVAQWYFLPEPKKSSENYESCKQNLKQHLEESVRLHLVSDVPVGSALSGGLDSSSLVALMRLQIPGDKPLHTFSAVYDATWEKDEKKYIDALIGHMVVSPTFVTPTADRLLQDLDQLIYQQEEPFASASLFASWCVYSGAHEKRIKVLLNGQGSDELFAYDYMAAFYFYELVRGFRLFTLIAELFSFFRKQQFGRKFTFSLFGFLLLPAFLRNKAVALFDPIIHKDFKSKYQSQFYSKFFSSKSLNENVRNHLLYKLHHLLRVEDKNSMFFSVEGRVPFLEVGLVEYSLNIPSSYKVHRGEVKYILKEVMKSHLPRKIYDRNDKIGFETPMDRWFRTEKFVNLIDQMLQQKDQPMEKYLNLEWVRNKWALHKSNQENNGKAIWKYISLTRWHQLYFHNK